MGLGMAKKRTKSGKGRAPARKKAPAHFIVAEDAEVIIERYPEDWIAMIIFWSLAFIVFLQFFTRYVLNDSLAWTEEIARYGLMWVTFIGGIMVTRRSTHIAVELMSNLMKPGPARVALLIFIDVVKLLFLALLAYFSITITERMNTQVMTVFDVPMSYVYAGVSVGCIGMFLRQAQNVWRNYKMQWRRPHDMHDQIIAD